MSDACRRDIPGIVSAAINCGGQIFALPPPARHAHIIGHMLRQGVDADLLARGAPGFLVADGRFVLRHLALRIARRAGQVALDADDRRGLRCEDVIYPQTDRQAAPVPVTEPETQARPETEPELAADQVPERIPEHEHKRPPEAPAETFAVSSFEEARARLRARSASGDGETDALARMMRQTASEMLRRAEELMVLSAELESGRPAHLLPSHARVEHSLEAGE